LPRRRAARAFHSALVEPILREFADPGAAGRSAAAADAVRVQRDGDVDHSGRGDRSGVLGAPPAGNGALCRRGAERWLADGDAVLLESGRGGR